MEQLFKLFHNERQIDELADNIKSEQKTLEKKVV